nr:MAG: hypothetical protein [Bacteriophage sp.]
MNLSHSFMGGVLISETMIIVKNKIIPFGSYTTINLFGILFTKSDYLSLITINHERIHTKQMLELLIVGYYLWYIIEYIIVRFCHKKQNDAYHDISFEEEAHNNDNNLHYLDNRKHFAWWKYVRLRSAE